jgi:hypothetical protein
MDYCRNKQENNTACVWATACLVVVAVCGCREASLPLAAVRGTVVYQGQALDHGRVVFSPVDGTTGPQAVGEIGPNGAFEMRTVDHIGAPIGKHRVTVHCRRHPTEHESKNLITPELLIPARYAREAESPLFFEVTKNADEYNIALE